MSQPRYYTDVPRTILWLIPGTEGEAPEAPGGAVIEPFYLGKFPVTNEEFEAFDPGFERHPGSPGDGDPAMSVSWADADEYCHWYAEVSRKPMRLPTEAEWEHACRGGADPAATWFWGDDPAAGEAHAWSAENSGGRLRALDEKSANGFGLFGMLGGVWEWTAGGADEEGGDDGQRILRGGSYRTPLAEATCTARRVEPGNRAIPDAGFRVARALRIR